MSQIRTEGVYEDVDKKQFDYSNYSAKSKYYNNSNALVIGKIKDGKVWFNNQINYWIKAKHMLVSSG